MPRMHTDRRKPQSTPEARSAMVACYRSGRLAPSEIASRFGVSERTVYREAAKAGVLRRARWLDDEASARIVRLYAGGRGKTMAQIAQETGFVLATIRKALREAGVKIRRGRRYDG